MLKLSAIEKYISLRYLAGISLTVGGIILLCRGEYEKGMILLVGELSFFVGETNGRRVKD